MTHALRGDARLRERQIEPALREMEQAFCLLIVRADPRLPDQIGRHHAGLLARLLTVADDLPQGRVRLLALAKVDRLLDRRADMQRAYTQLRPALSATRAACSSSASCAATRGTRAPRCASSSPT